MNFARSLPVSSLFHLTNICMVEEILIFSDLVSLNFKSSIHAVICNGVYSFEGKNDMKR